ncbi:MAG: S1/P1 nuclease [Vulcanimicrobiota bacterium]
MKKFFVLAFLLALVASPGAAWNAEGHRTVAHVAEADLSDDAKEEIRIILQEHPYDEVRSLADSAVWPDVVRTNPAYHRANWHYTNIPFFDGIDERPVPSETDILWAINRVTRDLKNERATRRQKAIALSWAAHLIGDIHQPLHATSRYSSDFPSGDRGGNSFQVKFGQRSVKLHGYWDSAGGLYWRGANSGRVRHIADDFREEMPRVEGEMAIVDPRAWADESYQLARDVVYKDLNPGDVLSNDYVNKARDTSKKRMTLAGYRLADFLNRVFE